MTTMEISTYRLERYISEIRYRTGIRGALYKRLMFHKLQGYLKIDLWNMK
jgi:hypothetical protein